jgi:hypothetical protein
MTVYLSVELRGKDNESLWSSRITPGKFQVLWNGVTQDLANQQVKKLLEALHTVLIDSAFNSVAAPYPLQCLISSVHSIGRCNTI